MALDQWTITLRCCSRSPPTFQHNPGSAAALAEGRPGHIRDEFPERPVGPRLKTPVRAASPKLPKSPSSRTVGNDRPGRPSTILDPVADARPARHQRNGSPWRGTEAHRRPHTAAPAGTPEVSPAKGHLCLRCRSRPPTGTASGERSTEGRKRRNGKSAKKKKKRSGERRLVSKEGADLPGPRHPPIHRRRRRRYNEP